jgi:hypothetical protein
MTYVQEVVPPHQTLTLLALLRLILTRHDLRIVTQNASHNN